MKLPKTKADELWLRACAKVAIEEAERPEDGMFARDLGLIEFALLWLDECAEVVWNKPHGPMYSP